MSLSSFCRHDFGDNVSCRPHDLQGDLFLKIYSRISLYQNFLGYNAIAIAIIYVLSKTQKKIVNFRTIVIKIFDEHLKRDFLLFLIDKNKIVTIYVET
jgi:hypothetical protein